MEAIPGCRLAHLVEQLPLAQREVSIIPEHRQQGQAFVATETRRKRGGQQALLVLRDGLELDKAVVGKLEREREREGESEKAQDRKKHSTLLFEVVGG